MRSHLDEWIVGWWMFILVYIYLIWEWKSLLRGEEHLMVILELSLGGKIFRQLAVKSDLCFLCHHFDVLFCIFVYRAKSIINILIFFQQTWPTLFGNNLLNIYTLLELKTIKINFKRKIGILVLVRLFTICVPIIQSPFPSWQICMTIFMWTLLHQLNYTMVFRLKLPTMHYPN